MPNYNAELDDYKPSANQNMSTLVSSSLEQDLKKQILGRSEAEKTFRPWWDTVEDYLLNSLVLLGKLIDLISFTILLLPGDHIINIDNFVPTDKSSSNTAPSAVWSSSSDSEEDIDIFDATKKENKLLGI